MTDRDSISPGVRRALGEARSHTAEAHRQIADLAKERSERVPLAPAAPSDDWDLDTARHEIEALHAAVARKPEPSHPQIVVLDGRARQSSSPPSSRHRGSKLAGVAAILAALGAAAAGIGQCASQVPHERPHGAPASAQTHP